VHKGYEVAKDFDPFKNDLTQKLQKVRMILATTLNKYCILFIQSILAVMQQ